MCFTRRDVRDHVVSSKSITDFRGGVKKSDAVAEKSKDQPSRDFLGCSILDFCNNIDPKQTCDLVLTPPAAHNQGTCEDHADNRKERGG